MNRAAVPSVSRKLGSGRLHGTLSWDEQREERRKQLFSVFLSLLHQLNRGVFSPPFFRFHFITLELWAENVVEKSFAISLSLNGQSAVSVAVDMD